MGRRKDDRLSHFFLSGTSEARSFTAYAAPRPPKVIPELPRAQHGQHLLRQVRDLKRIAHEVAQDQVRAELESGIGLQVTFESREDVELAFESLAYEPGNIELLSLIQHEGNTTANVFVPEGRLEHFEKYILEYLEEHRTARGQVRDHKALLNTISAIRRAEVRGLWGDDEGLLPANSDEEFWWEVWLPVRNDREAVLRDFNKLAGLARCQVGERVVNFPERQVVMMYGSERKLASANRLLTSVAELRRAKETAQLFLGEKRETQLERTTALADRTTAGEGGEEIPYICLIDSGLTRGHPLLRRFVAAEDLHTINPAWGVEDKLDHGTAMGGLALYGDLSELLAGQDDVKIEHRIESVKILDQNGGNVGDDAHHAYLFAEAVSRPEVDWPERRRVFATAITASDYRDRGKPSSWSAALDSLAASVDSEGSRLFIVSAGNTVDPAAWAEYPHSLTTNLIHDPGQAWNAITVGGYTEKIRITEDDAGDLMPIAQPGDLSPRTTTSATWNNAWPLKPDVVFEAGNVARDALGAVGMESLDLLSTSNSPTGPLFTNTNGTSAASAQCAKFAAELMTRFPRLRMETIRGLILHSAQWKPEMKARYVGRGRASKAQWRNLIRHCGWGIPDMPRAVWSATNSLTLVVEDELRPYKRERGEAPKTRDMHLHRLPWPKEALEELQDAGAVMRVTLSYFVEPNPSSRGMASRYHYPSARLRFDLRRPLETTDSFLGRINAAAARMDDEDEANVPDPRWHLGANYRHRGSLHQDVWEGGAAELARRGLLAVYPAAGWWRTRPKLQRYELPIKYSLIVSIETPETEADLYVAVEQQIAAGIAVET
jgi:subtilase family protein